MQISSTKSTQVRPSNAAPASDQAVSSKESQSVPSDSFSFSSSIDVKSGLMFGALGLLPVIGVVSNFGAGAESGFNDNPLGATAGGVGALSNLGGTAVLLGGAVFGSSTAVKVGLGMLGISGLAGAYAGFY